MVLLWLAVKVTVLSALDFKAGLARMEWYSVEEVSSEVGDLFLTHFILTVFQFLFQRKCEDLNCVQESWSYFSDKDFF